MRNNLIMMTFALLQGALVSSAGAGDNPVLVTVDRAKIFRVDDGASAVIVGNPFIADVAMFDQNTVVITGKSYGSTNLVILDKDNKPIVDEIIMVRGSDENVVSVYRNAARSTMSCSPHCEPTLRLGDAVEKFDEAAGQADARNKLAEAAANGG